MKLLITLLIAIPLAAQNLPNDFVALGASFNQQLSPPISGWGTYAKRITDKTYSFNVIDITSKTLKPFTVQSTTSTGIAQYMGEFNKTQVFLLGNIGVAAGGENVGLAYSGGAAIVTKIKNNICLIIPIRIMKTTIGQWQGVIGLGFGMRRE